MSQGEAAATRVMWVCHGTFAYCPFYDACQHPLYPVPPFGTEAKTGRADRVCTSYLPERKLLFLQDLAHRINHWIHVMSAYKVYNNTTMNV